VQCVIFSYVLFLLHLHCCTDCMDNRPGVSAVHILPVPQLLAAFTHYFTTVPVAQIKWWWWWWWLYMWCKLLMIFWCSISYIYFVAELLTIYSSDHLDLTDTRGLYIDYCFCRTSDECSYWWIGEYLGVFKHGTKLTVTLITVVVYVYTASLSMIVGVAQSYSENICHAVSMRLCQYIKLCIYAVIYKRI